MGIQMVNPDLRMPGCLRCVDESSNDVFEIDEKGNQVKQKAGPSLSAVALVPKLKILTLQLGRQLRRFFRFGI